MHYPKIRPPTRHVIKQNKDSPKITASRISLIVWAFLRLAVSILWTCFLILVSAERFPSPYTEATLSWWFFIKFAIVIQVIEFGMLVTFIVAGFKKSASLYHAYYWYCILSFIIYVISVTLCLSLDHHKGHYFGELYIFYHFYHVDGFNGNYKLVFFIASIIDIVLEINLICMIKMLINNYRHHGKKYAAGQSE